jgi:hypothetical protein
VRFQRWVGYNVQLFDVQLFDVQSFDVGSYFFKFSRSMFEVQSFQVQSVNLSLSSSQPGATVPLREGRRADVISQKKGRAGKV